MTVYFNVKYGATRETVDELTREDFPSYRAFREETRRMVKEYQLAGIPVYTSRRCCAGWND